MGERREAFRRRVYLGGRVVDRRAGTDACCLIRNLTPDGALLVLDDTTALPDGFDVAIDSHGTTRSAEIAWRDGVRVGVRFLPDDAGPHEVAALRGSIADCRNQLARLRARVAEIERVVRPAVTVLH